VTFKALIEDAGGGGAYVRIPFDVEKEFGKKRLPVQSWIDGEPYRSTLVRMGGPFHILAVLKEIRQKLGKNVGDEVEIVIEEDTALRIVEIPSDLLAALESQPGALESFRKLSYTHQKEHVRAILEAKQPATHQKRIMKALEILLGKK
jgi:bifunctional DNA-binding transcriptional regulator/antitoxin component of YhaV-PrlF toxin-antitoxin module